MTDGDTEAPLLVLGPLLRYVGETEATIWVETDRACAAEILGRQARTFEVSGHHYALVVIGDLEPGAEYEYQVALDGAVRWPEPDSEFPPSVLRTPDPYVAGTLLAVRRVADAAGVRRGLDSLLFED